ncbi:protein mono-ADP-ribosyltransferase PARP15-like [Discoglossus pictus]
MSQLVINEVAVVLKKGDITQENTDAIVNLNNKTLDQNFGVSKEILNAAGSSVQEECKRLGKQPHNDVVISGAGNLKCTKIFHVIGAVTPPSIKTAVKKVLKECDENDLRTVSFPAIGTGAANLNSKISIDSMLDAINTYLSDAMDTTMISEIYIVVFTENVYQDYLQVFQSRNLILQSASDIIISGNRVELIKGDITEQAVDGVVNLTNQSLNQTIGVSKAILGAAGISVKEECERIGTISYGKIIVTSGGNLKSKKILHLIGPTSVSAIPASVEQILKQCDDCSFKSVALPAIGTGIACIDPTKSVEGILDGITKYFLSNSGSSLWIYIVSIKEDIYLKYLQVFQAKNQSLQTIPLADQTPKRRRAIIGTPLAWAPMDKNDNLKLVVLDKSSDEYQRVEKNFINSSGKRDVIQITRIQNVKLYQSYTVKIQAVDRQYPDHNNERRLYHGTNFQAVKEINQNGFNRSLCGANATCFGEGTYFARDASYSCNNTYSPPHDGLKYVYQAAVVTGKWCMGLGSYKEPPKIENSDVRYNSVVDNVKNPSMFVIFCDDGAYPEYLITFK